MPLCKEVLTTSVIVVNLDQLLGAVRTQKLVKILFQPFSSIFVDIRRQMTDEMFNKVLEQKQKYKRKGDICICKCSNISISLYIELFDIEITFEFLTVKGIPILVDWRMSK